MFVNTAALNQRSSPDGSIVGKLSGGDAVSVFERSGNWARISRDNSTPLWVSGSHRRALGAAPQQGARDPTTLTVHALALAIVSVSARAADVIALHQAETRDTGCERWQII
jgi:hypothetical protein